VNSGTPGSVLGMPGQRPLAVVDIDGVVADVRHRLHFVDGSPRRWDAFFAAAKDDPPLAEGVRRVHGLLADHDVVYLTGRPERIRRATEKWLAEQGIGGLRVIMRRDSDRRPARQLKKSELAKLARSATVALMLDDDPAVCAELRAAGYPVEQATWMTRPAALDEAQERAGRT
jgi:phosphoglycolate phosphatase-like HAD superfamily hydrolase